MSVLEDESQYEGDSSNHEFGEQYEFVGECYLDEFMYGEAERKVKDSLRQGQRFTRESNLVWGDEEQ